MSDGAPTNVHLVVSHPPSGISDEVFRAWYEGHLREILRIPQFVSAKLYDLDVVPQIVGEPLPYRYLAAYEFQGPAEDAMAGIAAAREAGGLTIPDWFPRFKSEGCIIAWNGLALTDLLHPES